jgi:hypothetical protein
MINIVRGKNLTKRVDEILVMGCHKVTPGPVMPRRTTPNDALQPGCTVVVFTDVNNGFHIEVESIQNGIISGTLIREEHNRDEFPTQSEIVECTIEFVHEILYMRRCIE